MKLPTILWENYIFLTPQKLFESTDQKVHFLFVSRAVNYRHTVLFNTYAKLNWKYLNDEATSTVPSY
jgi:hypothetical protein